MRSSKRFFDEMYASTDQDRQKWGKLLQRFIDVLGVELLVMDKKGRVLLRPNGNGGRRRSAKNILMSILGERFSAGDDLLAIFDKRDDVLEYQMACGLHVFAVPLKVLNFDGFLIVGPVAITKRPSEDDCLHAAEVMGFAKDEIFDMVHQVRVMSFVMVSAVLDLFKEMAQWLSETFFLSGIPGIRDDNDKIILERLLKVAMHITGANSGTIMLAHGDMKYLEVKICRGGKKKDLLGECSPVDASVSGEVFSRQKPCILKGQEGDSRLRPFLKRLDVKQSLVMPLVSKGEAFGVMNLNAEGGRAVDFSKQLSDLSGLIKILL